MKGGRRTKSYKRNVSQSINGVVCSLSALPTAMRSSLVSAAGYLLLFISCIASSTLLQLLQLMMMMTRIDDNDDDDCCWLRPTVQYIDIVMSTSFSDIDFYSIK